MDDFTQELQEPSDQSIPERSNFWFSDKSKASYATNLFDQISVIFSTTLALFAFIVFWPIITKINFEEAFFTPLAPFLINILGFFGTDANQSIRILFIASFMISTIGLYLLVRDLTKRQVTAILAALIYLIPPIPVFVLTFIRQGLYPQELESAKLFFTIIYGDGAHFLALAIIPFAILFLLRYLKAPTKINFLATTIACSLIFLATRSQALSLILILSIVAITEFFLGLARVKIRRFLLALFFTIGLVSFWYTPSFLIESILLYKMQLLENIRLLFPFSLIFITLSLSFAFAFFAKNEKRQPIFIALSLFIVFSVIVLDWFFHHRSFIPHVHRLFANINMFGAIVISLSLSGLFDRLHLVEKFGFETWSHAAKSLGTLAFGLAAFIILAIAALTLSPIFVLAIGQQGGLWSQISSEVISDRTHSLSTAGENFKLVRLATGDNLQNSIGLVMTAVFLIALGLILARDDEEET